MQEDQGITLALLHIGHLQPQDSFPFFLIGKHGVDHAVLSSFLKELKVSRYSAPPMTWKGGLTRAADRPTGKARQTPAGVRHTTAARSGRNSWWNAPAAPLRRSPGSGSAGHW
jgi:hypothetical protein